MPGKIALVGSGEYLPAMTELENQLLSEGIKQGKNPLYIQIPTAAGQESKQRIQYWKDLGKAQADNLEVEVRFLPVFNREDAFNPEHVSMIEDGALMYMSGGDPHYLAHVLSDTPLWDAIYKNWSSGASLAGCSAGAMVLSKEIPNFRFLKREPTTGLNLLPSIRVIPHFDKFFRWIPDSAAKVLMQAPEDTVLVGIDEMTALVQSSTENEWSVFGRSAVHILQGLPTQQLRQGEKIVIP